MHAHTHTSPASAGSRHSHGPSARRLRRDAARSLAAVLTTLGACAALQAAPAVAQIPTGCFTPMVNGPSIPAARCPGAGAPTHAPPLASE